MPEEPSEFEKIAAFFNEEGGNPPTPPEKPELPRNGLGWELDLGIKWFSRLGIVALLIGLGMALNYQFHQVFADEPIFKILTGWGITLAMFFMGSRLHKRFQLLGRILQGGGLALGYLTMFGTFFIPAMRLPFLLDPGLQSLGWGLLALYVTGMILYSRKLDSRTIAILSLAFGYYTASYSGSQLVAFTSTLLLGGASVILGNHRPGWSLIPKISLVGFVFTYLNWHFTPFHGTEYITGLRDFLFNDDTFDEVVYLLLNFFIFHLASLLPAVSGKDSYANLGLNMASSFLTFCLFVMTQTFPLFGVKGLFEAIIAVVQFSSLALMLQARTEHDQRFQTQGHLVLGTVFSIFSVFGFLNADMQPIALAGGAMALGLMSHQGRYSPLFEGLSFAVLVLAFIALSFFNWTAISVGILLMTVGSVCLAGLVLEKTVFGAKDEVLRIFMMLCSGFVFLGALMIGLQSYWITFAIVLTGFGFLMSGFFSGEARYRWMGLGWIFLAGFRLVTIDLLTLQTPYKIMLFIALGLTMLAGSFGYNLLNRKLAEQKNSTENS